MNIHLKKPKLLLDCEEKKKVMSICLTKTVKKFLTWLMSGLLYVIYLFDIIMLFQHTDIERAQGIFQA